ncbi:hypothetical protein GA0070623_0646 [Micromonospora rifamycinica]|uniref:Uncharacterized protein n=1 Tax=Micromonospora rifamycinica TaxID=291594 RepID=A0A1C5H2H8_9ACTN|nr:hypothetical protein GA0070623_0646 [Micromonospora rifamycinica]
MLTGNSCEGEPVSRQWLLPYFTRSFSWMPNCVLLTYLVMYAPTTN